MGFRGFNKEYSKVFNNWSVKEIVHGFLNY